MLTPRISVVMAIYNGQEFLREAIDSVLSQTMRDFELVIVNDGSTDDSLSIVESYADPRIRIVSQENTGLAQALNNGISVSNGEYIARMDQDDICLPERFDVQLGFLQEHPDVVAVGCGAIYMDEAGKDVCHVRMPETHEEILLRLPESPFIHPSVIFRKSCWEESGGYFAKFTFGAEDTVFFNKISKLGRLHNVQESLFRYRVSRSATSRRSRAQNQKLMGVIRRVVATDEIVDEDVEFINKLRSGITAEEKACSYHLCLARLHLQGGDKRAVRFHACSAMKSGGGLIDGAGLVVLSMVPQGGIKWLKRTVEHFRGWR